jgi:hypothetical protein
MAGKCLFTHAFSNIPKLINETIVIIIIRKLIIEITLAEASQAPETNVFISGDNESDITSPVCP